MADEVVLAAVAGHFGRDVARTLVKLEGVIGAARAAGAHLLVLPDATIGGYVDDLVDPAPGGEAALPPAVALDGPEVARVAELAGDVVVCFGISELDDDDASGRPARYNTAVCVHRGAVLGVHRKVHLPLGESRAYRAGNGFAAFDTPIGRMGMLVDFDKTFPESARTLALDGAEVLACLSAWPASATERADRIRLDRQARLFDLYDAARAAENQVWLVSSNQTGVQGGLRFLGQAKVVDPAGEVVARTWTQGGMAVAPARVAEGVARARRKVHHLRDRVLSAYAVDRPFTPHKARSSAYPEHAVPGQGPDDDSGDDRGDEHRGDDGRGA
ncbi:nitrilase [Quadrisphaera granulorum]|uniref:Nitrilase n=1 Tax=Quadrisphaera granulorum TaxID=317664 RepID=A0A316A788_9ACTN|nr:carbon-nitrogen hydrolase family protein [Quadrisphaera granulorum]PWJ53463.1 nitrilase [Quadrisphaera granulorum]SZE96805.1 nitrilase [Quadrisphaera granulorum]